MSYGLFLQALRHPNDDSFTSRRYWNPLIGNRRRSGSDEGRPDDVNVDLLTKQMKSRVTVLPASIVLLLALTGCHGLSISVNDVNPPVFTFSAGQLAECCTHLPFLVVYEIPVGDDERKVIWHIQPLPGTDNSANGLPKITYGQVPQGFLQLVPVEGAPPALEEGKVYAASGPRVEVPDAFVTFRIENGKVIRTPE